MIQINDSIKNDSWIGSQYKHICGGIKDGPFQISGTSSAPPSICKLFIFRLLHMYIQVLFKNSHLCYILYPSVMESLIEIGTHITIFIMLKHVSEVFKFAFFEFWKPFSKKKCIILEFGGAAMLAAWTNLGN